MYRPTKALINLPALANNLKLAKEMAPQSKVLAVIKANGYGHGIERVAQQLSAADAFGVASIEEAMLLRQKGFLHRILLLEGLFSDAEIPIIVQNRLDLVIHSEYQLKWLLNSHIEVPLTVWIKVDTGMHRLGFDVQQLQSIISQLENSPHNFVIHIMSHFASADEHNSDGQLFTEKQLKIFNKATKPYDYPKSLANSAGVIHYPESHFQWIRPGIFLYGAGIYNEQSNSGYIERQQAVMQLESEIIAIKTVQEGEYVGYGNTWQADRKSKIGVVAIGYGDGYPWHAKNGTPVLINGQKMPLVGRVSMDMITVDLTDALDSVAIGDKVILWGADLSVDEVAQFCGTIGYELLCNVTQRVPMIEIQ